MRKKNEPIIQAIRRQLGNENEVEMVNKEWPLVGDFQVTIRLRKVNQYGAIVIDEMGYVQQNQMEMEVFFTLLAKSSERSSMLTASNLPFSKWEKVFKGPITASAAVDRFVNHSIILNFTIPGYGLEQVNKSENNKEKPMSKISNLKHHNELDGECGDQRWTKQEIEECVTFVRLELYNRAMPCGPKSVQERLTEFYHVKQTPSERKISRILARHGLNHGRTGIYEE